MSTLRCLGIAPAIAVAIAAVQRQEIEELREQKMQMATLEVRQIRLAEPEAAPARDRPHRGKRRARHRGHSWGDR